MKPPTRTPPASASAAQIAAWLLLLTLVTFISLRGWDTFQVGIYQDDAVYVLLARSLAFTDHYGLINQPGVPRPSKFPFIFPLVLTPLVRAFPTDLVVCTLVPLASTLLNISLLFWGWPLLSPGAGRWWGLAAGTLYGLSPQVMGQTRAVLAEPLFTSFVLGALMLTESLVRERRPRRWSPLALGVLLTLAVCTRWIGIALCGAVLMRLGAADWSTLPRRLVAIVSGAIGSLALILILTPIDLQQIAPAQHLRSRQQRMALRDLDDASMRREMKKTAVDYVRRDVRQVLVAVGGGEREQAAADRLGLRYLPIIASVLVTALVGFGAWHSARDEILAPSVLLFEGLYCVVLALWPFISTRLLYPLLPFFFVQLLSAVRAIANAGKPRERAKAFSFGNAAATVTFVLLAGTSVWKSARIEDSKVLVGDLQVLPGWLSSHTPADAVVMTESPERVFLYSNRATVPLMKTSSIEEFEDALIELRVNYLLLAPELRWRQGAATYSWHVRTRVLPLIDALTARGRITLADEAADLPLVRLYRVQPRSS